MGKHKIEAELDPETDLNMSPDGGAKGWRRWRNSGRRNDKGGNALAFWNQKQNAANEIPRQFSLELCTPRLVDETGLALEASERAEDAIDNSIRVRNSYRQLPSVLDHED